MTNWTTFFPPETEVMALPMWRSPRLFIAASGSPSQRWRRSALYPAFRVRARVLRWLLQLGAAAAILPTRTVPAAQEWALGTFIRESLPEVVSVSVLRGWPGPAQKITVQCWNERGEVAGYLKYGEQPAARARVERERRVLEQLRPGLGPDLLKGGAWQQGELLLVTPLPGDELRPTLPPQEAIVQFTQQLARAAEHVDFGEHPWMRRRTWPAALMPCLDALAGRAWPVVVQHGDLAPWNLRRDAAGGLRAFDWEYGTLDGFPYMDLAHYMLKVGGQIKRWPPAQAVEYAAAHLADRFPTALSRREAHALMRLSAYDTYREEEMNGHDVQNRWQQWRREAWQHSL